MIKGIIFDFNGTLYFDHDINYRAWNNTIDEITNKEYDFKTLYEKVGKGKPNNIFLDYVLELCHKENTMQTRDWWSHHKEESYQQIGIDENRTHLFNGAEDFMNQCLKNEIPMNIATASIEFNVDFYYKYFNLENWVSRKKIAYDDGALKNKVEMYKEAAKRIGLDISECVVFEDSPHAINDAINAGCKNIVFVNSQNLIFNCPQILKEIKDFTEISLEEIKNSK